MPIISSGFVAAKGASTESYEKGEMSGNRMVPSNDPRERDFTIHVGQRVEVKPPPGFKSRVKYATVSSINSHAGSARIMPEGSDYAIEVPIKYLLPEGIRQKYYIRKVGSKNKEREEQEKGMRNAVNEYSSQHGVTMSTGKSSIGEVVNDQIDTGANPRVVDIFYPAGRKKEAKVQGDHEFASNEELSRLSKEDRYAGHKLEANRLLDEKIISKEIGEKHIKEEKINGDSSIVVELLGGKTAKKQEGQGTNHEDIDENVEEPDNHLDSDIAGILDSVISDSKEHVNIQELKDKGRLNSGLLISKHTNAPVNNRQDSKPFSEDITGEYDKIVEDSKRDAPTVVVASKNNEILEDTVREILEEESEGAPPPRGMIDSRKIAGACRSEIESRFEECWGVAIKYDSLKVIEGNVKLASKIGEENKCEVLASVDAFMVNEGENVNVKISYTYYDTPQGNASFKGALVEVGDKMVEMEDLNEEILHLAYDKFSSKE